MVRDFMFSAAWSPSMRTRTEAFWVPRSTRPADVALRHRDHLARRRASHHC
jgi:hypothetical protein